MSDASPAPRPLLLGIFRHLQSQGVPLSTRDYLDGLRALDAERETDRAIERVGRERLRWLCRTLWTRTAAEGEALDLLFDALPRPSAQEVAEVETWLGLREEMEDEPDMPGAAAEGASTADTATAATTTAAAEPQDGAPPTSVRFGGADEHGVGVPEAPGLRPTPARPGELFVLSERPPVAVRALAIAWRRFRRPKRTGPRTELDLGASIAQTTRQGWLEAPVLVARRRNQAELTVFLDASPSMAPWRRFLPIFTDSLVRSELRRVDVRYFDNLPTALFHDRELTVPVTAEAPRAKSPLLILSDAGAARGRSRARRARATRAFLDAGAEGWSATAWLNPMPRGRWLGTSAEAIAEALGGAMFPLTEDGLIRAIDVLRGRRER